MRILFFCLILISACGGGPNPDREALREIPQTQNLNGEIFEVLSQESLNFGSGILAGTGSVRFAQDLESAASNFNFLLRFTLEDAGELSLVTHSNRALENGVVVNFKRTAEVLSVSISTANIAVDRSSFFSSLDASKPLNIAIDIHNDEAVTHTVFWNESTGDELLDFADNAGVGVGQNWGLILKNATVSQAEKAPPRDEH